MMFHTQLQISSRSVASRNLKVSKNRLRCKVFKTLSVYVRYIPCSDPSEEKIGKNNTPTKNIHHPAALRSRMEALQRWIALNLSVTS